MPDGATDRVILVDKPAGRTSHDVVAAVRRDVGGPRKGPGVIRVGHAGTLDPFATGLLVVLVGRATRVQSLFMGLDKTYVTRARFGATSTTGDPDGEIAETGVLPARPLVLPTGVISQRPPAYSAIQVDGVRAYTRARRGEDVQLPEREVTVHRFEELAEDEFLIECSSGTYVRSLIADLGDAYCTALRRTRIGPFSVDETERGPCELGLCEALQRFLEVIQLGGEEARHAAHGIAVPGTAESTVLLADSDGPIAIAQPRAGSLLKPVVGFRG
jgi:tRNA pseudouridine55 synthase